MSQKNGHKIVVILDVFFQAPRVYGLKTCFNNV